MTSSDQYRTTYPGSAAGGSATGYIPETAVPGTYDLQSPVAEDPSTTDVAKDQAASVAGGATDAAQQVAGVAKDQVGQVTAEAGKQVKQLVGQAQSELSDQAQVQQEKLAGGLHSVGDQLSAMAKNSDQPGLATDLAHQAADRAHQVAGWLEQRDPGAVLGEVRSFARQRPGVFLAVALGAGLLAGRLARGLTADSSGSSDASGTARPAPVTPPVPRPAILDGQTAGLTNGTNPDGYGRGADWTGKPRTGLGDSR